MNMENILFTKKCCISVNKCTYFLAYLQYYVVLAEDCHGPTCTTSQTAVFEAWPVLA